MNNADDLGVLAGRTFNEHQAQKFGRLNAYISEKTLSVRFPEKLGIFEGAFRMYSAKDFYNDIITIYEKLYFEVPIENVIVYSNGKRALTTDIGDFTSEWSETWKNLEYTEAKHRMIFPWLISVGGTAISLVVMANSELSISEWFGYSGLILAVGAGFGFGYNHFSMPTSKEDRYLELKDTQIKIRHY